jgi:asparagine synthetase B (glutamine-hydrolysing)
MWLISLRDLEWRRHFRARHSGSVGQLLSGGVDSAEGNR